MNVQAGGPVRPSGIVTFLFTDIEGSTRRWEADPDLMRSALEAHDAVLREAIEKYTGWLFKHTGDGVCAVFSSPQSAVDAAIAAQRALELPVRMGIATGEAEQREGDYFGAVLNRAARVMSAGHGGQVLLDGQTAGLLSGVELTTLGTKQLRDIANPVDVLQVVAHGLQTDFPPLRTVDHTPGNLRAQTTSFVGREAELADIARALEKHRLVTLTGVGGVGKTRLALEVAFQSAGRYPDGVFLIELAAVGDPMAVPAAVAATMGINHQPGMSMAESVSSALEGRKRLLVFDNCEHVLDASADLVEAILSRSATVRVLATSREGLRLADERLWPLASLDTQAGPGSAAATLFVDRASAVAPGISLKDAGDAIVEVCQRLDGIPLAIELAASRLISMTLTDVRDRLDDRFRLLVGARRGLERHQTLRHAVAWSYDLLDDAERALLQQCSVFAGGFDLAAVRAVADSADEYATLNVLDGLVRKSLVVAGRTTEHARFTMLETIRQFAEEQLVASGGADAARTAHATYFAGRERDVLALWDSPRQRETYEWFASEFANLRAAFRWASDREDLDGAAAIAFYSTFFGTWAYQSEAFGWAEELIEHANAVEHPRLAQLYAASTQCAISGRIAHAVAYADASQLAINSGRFDDVPFDFEAWAGAPYMMAGQPGRWVTLCRNLIARRPGPHVSARTCLTMALAFEDTIDEAIERSEALLADSDRTDNPSMIAWARLAYGVARRDTDPDRAYEVTRAGLAIALETGNRLVASHLADNLSRLSATHRDLSAEAFTHTAQAIRIHLDAGSLFLLTSPLASLAALLDRLGRREPAATIAGFVANPLVFTTFPEVDVVIAHLRSELGDEAYESLARAGSQMIHAEMATYAFDQIDLARAELS
jgi:predicted ATPase/class 3 adenylate cyclase